MVTGEATNGRVGVIGAGTMGSGIAQLMAQSGFSVVLFDISDEALQRGRLAIEKNLKRELEKGRIKSEQCESFLNKIEFCSSLKGFAKAELVIEAVVEDLDLKKKLFSALEAVLSDSSIIASNTSSLSIASLGAALKRPERFLGLHFFNPAPVMPLVEIIPGIRTEQVVVERATQLVKAWGKVGVRCKDTPGFIVNRVARPYYGEALRILEEGIADVATIDSAMKSIGGFKMGPFELMDFIGIDINYKVTEGVFEAFYYDPRYRPSLTQKRMLEAGLLGRKSGRGFYDYKEGQIQVPESSVDLNLKTRIFNRIIVMLMNEALDAVYMGVAGEAEIDLAMTKGVNYPKGLIVWAEQFGHAKLLGELRTLQADYAEDRYRASQLLVRLVNKRS